MLSFQKVPEQTSSTYGEQQDRYSCTNPLMNQMIIPETSSNVELVMNNCTVNILYQAAKTLIWINKILIMMKFYSCK